MGEVVSPCAPPLNAPINFDDVKTRLTGADPFFGGFGWTMSAPPEGVITRCISVNFPEPEAVAANSITYIHVWVGSVNVDPDLGTFLLNVDRGSLGFPNRRFPGLRSGTSQVPEIPVFPDRSL